MDFENLPPALVNLARQEDWPPGTDEKIRALILRHASKRNIVIWAARKCGATYRAIGQTCDIGPERVRQIEVRQERRLNEPSPRIATDYTASAEYIAAQESITKKRWADVPMGFLALSVRPDRILREEGAGTVQDVLELFAYVDRLMRIPTFGIKCLREIKVSLQHIGALPPE